MRYAIIGSRGFNDYNMLKRYCSCFMERNKSSPTIISGGASGADSLGKQYAFENNYSYVEYLPDWNKHGKSAGYIRNKLIINDSDFVIAFWDGVSKGTKHSIDLAKEKKLPTLIVYY